MTHASKKTPTARQLVAAKQARRAPSSPSPATAPTNGKEPSKEVAPGAVDDAAYVDAVLDAIAPSGIVGRLVKYSPKDARFVTSDDGKPIAEDAVFAALLDQTVHGYMKFNGPGEPPDRIMGLLYSSFRLPLVKDLPDRDQSTWELGLDGAPADPWQYHYYVVLQSVGASELHTFDTSSPTGRRAVGELLRHGQRMRSSGDVPLIWLRSGGYQHRDERIGWVNKPMFVVCGRRPADSVIKPDGSTAAILNDELKFDRD